MYFMWWDRITEIISLLLPFGMGTMRFWKLTRFNQIFQQPTACEGNWQCKLLNKLKIHIVCRFVENCAVAQAMETIGGLSLVVLKMYASSLSCTLTYGNSPSYVFIFYNNLNNQCVDKTSLDIKVFVCKHYPSSRIHVCFTNARNSFYCYKMCVYVCVCAQWHCLLCFIGVLCFQLYGTSLYWEKISINEVLCAVIIPKLNIKGMHLWWKVFLAGVSSGYTHSRWKTFPLYVCVVNDWRGCSVSWRQSLSYLVTNWKRFSFWRERWRWEQRETLP